MPITDEQMELSRQYKERRPASLCICGHTGDGADSQHLDTPVSKGHGGCTARGCACVQFRWGRFRIPYKTFVGVK